MFLIKKNTANSTLHSHVDHKLHGKAKSVKKTMPMPSCLKKVSFPNAKFVVVGNGLSNESQKKADIPGITSSLKGIGTYLGPRYHLRIHRRCLQAKQL